MTYVSICEEDMAIFKRIAGALEGIERKMTPAKVVEYGPETVEATQKLLSDIADDIEEELKNHMRKAYAECTTGRLYEPEALYMTAIGDFMEVFNRALNKVENKMKKEEKE